MNSSLPRVRLANLPTPLHRLPRLSDQLGVELWIKRDDLTGLATGGNKTRKLEFLIADAVGQGADCVITAGGPQSNHCRQTAAAAAQHGLACHLVLGGPASPADQPPPLGNLLLDRVLGATLHWVDKPDRNRRMRSLADELAASGNRPYVIPIGGSNALGAIGYVVAFEELSTQSRSAGVSFDRVVFPTSSGGTQAGLVLGAKQADFGGRVTAISIDAAPGDRVFLEGVAGVANGAAELLETDQRTAPEELDVEYGYLGGGYGVVGDLERHGIRAMAQSEGVLLGPVYSGRCFGALLDMIASGKIAPGERVLFWHTGDESALHAYADAVLA